MCFLLDTTGLVRHNPRVAPEVAWAIRMGGAQERTLQYLPGWTVQCINPQCQARGQWLRAVLAGPFGSDHCCNCGEHLRNVPPPLGPQLRMRPRALTSRQPLRPRPR